jgi:hypothetical protein
MQPPSALRTSWPRKSRTPAFEKGLAFFVPPWLISGAMRNKAVNPPSARSRGVALALVVRLELILCDDLRLCDLADFTETLRELVLFADSEKARLIGDETAALSLRLSE